MHLHTKKSKQPKIVILVLTIVFKGLYASDASQGAKTNTLEKPILHSYSYTVMR